MIRIAACFLLFTAIISGHTVFAQNRPAFTQIDPRPFADNSNHWYNIFDKGNVINARPGKPRFKPTELTSIADNMVLFQKSNGGWPKNYDMFAMLTDDQKDSVAASKNVLNTTYDNGSTYNHIAALAQVYAVTGAAKYKKAVLRGFDYVMKSQYANGGWPQYYPLESNYSRHITFNDGAFVGVMELLKEVADNQPQFAFLDDPYRQRLSISYQKGLDCIIKTQINDAGQPTAWCQQHDEVTLAPAWARKFEPPSICNQESADLVLFLMSINHPQQAIIQAVQNAETWFIASEIHNTIVKTVPAPQLITAFRVSTTDRVVMTDSTAAPIWTRYYELKTHRPLFCNRDSKVVYVLAEVERERRDGYGWYTYAPQKVINNYAAWAQKWGVQQ